MAVLEALLQRTGIDPAASNLEQLHRREFYKEKEGRWDIFPPHSDIRDGKATFYVAETERGIEMGSAINFVSADDRVGFVEVEDTPLGETIRNPEAAR